MEFLSSILGFVPCLYDHTSKNTVYVRDLKKTLQALSKEMVGLNNLYEDVKARVEGAEQRQMMRRKEVGGWICEVEVMVTEVQEILRKGDQEIQKRCLGCCPRNCWSSYKIGKAVSEKLVAVSGQIGKGHFDVVAEMLPRPLVDELPMEKTVGSGLTYDRICRFLQDPQVGIMGLYGMGGVGKTTLLKKINNDFLTTSSDFDVVIWAVVSKPSNIERIQEVIWNKLQIPRDIWEIRSSKEEKAVEILRVLKTKKFVLLLDDIWERLDLLEMGVPRPDARNKSKIVFTTRSRDVCHQMKARESIEVTCLSSEAAWTLFQKEVGEETLSHPHILRLAKTVAEECKGLPLALVTLGRALAGERDPSDWDKVIQKLSKFPAEISGMEEELFHTLKVSYDRLSDNDIKSCFTYCSLFSEDWEIHNENIIRYWIGEGFLGEVHDIHEAWNRGHKYIKELKRACLLESCGLREKRVTMHDVIHDMALWLSSECGKERNKILIYNDVSRLKEAHKIPELKEIEKMSLWDKNVEKFPETLVCPNLKTLIVKGCYKLTKFSSEFFQFMPLIRVLDLSNNNNLSELPTEIGKLVALRYLNLSYTRIRELPIELRNLKNLMILLLDDIKSLGSIPQDVISSLISLKLFSNYAGSILSGVETMLEELESLNGLSEISWITIFNALSFKKLKSSHKLLRCISCLQFLKWGDVITLEISFPLLKGIEHLHELIISHCNELKAIKINVEGEGTNKDVTPPNYIVPCQKYFYTLREVGIDHCSKLLDLTWLVYAPNLEVLYVKDCESIEQVIHYGMEEKLEIFLRLKYIKLSKLPRLKSIYGHPLRFPSLEIIKVRKCKSLRSLPFDSTTSNKNLKKIKGEKSWWNQLEWNDETLKHSFTRYFPDDMQEQLISN
ncbi:hypothetical protein PVL29_011476 [Vitis rotundifolia]|uniref:AAA+ ATPase domain-containing protein n=1 Tax=Vitis rotundifolia TaxID=103349 RepID=A0AA38ZP92_VITRO|nr:hypothetical protein PVL29_011476 [Vitis rotundifolia]